MRWVYLDNSFVQEHEAFVPITDRGFLFGDGVFTTVKVENGVPELLQEHLLRLKEDAEQLSIDCPRVDSILIEELIKRNQAFNGTWRLKIIVTGGCEKGLCLPTRKGSLLMTLQPYQVEEKKVLRVVVYPYPVGGMSARLKTLSYVERLSARQYALDRGCDDAITVDGSGNVLEVSFGNIFWKNEGAYFTPSRNLPLYYGVSIQQLEKNLESDGIKLNLVERKIDNLSAETELFSINSLQGIKSLKKFENINTV